MDPGPFRFADVECPHVVECIAGLVTSSHYPNFFLEYHNGVAHSCGPIGIGIWMPDFLLLLRWIEAPPPPGGLLLIDLTSADKPDFIFVINTGACRKPFGDIVVDNLPAAERVGGPIEKRSFIALKLMPKYSIQVLIVGVQQEGRLKFKELPIPLKLTD